MHNEKNISAQCDLPRTIKTKFGKLVGKTPVTVRFSNGFVQTYDSIIRQKGTRIMNAHAKGDTGVMGCIEANAEVEVLLNPV